MEHPPINREHFELDKFAYSTHSAFVPSGFTAEDLTDPYYWSHVRALISTFDEIRAVAEDGSFVARLFVQSCSPSQVVVRVESWKAFDEAPAAPASHSRYSIAQKGRNGWCIVDNEDGSIIRKNLGPQSSAMRELEQLQRALAA